MKFIDEYRNEAVARKYLNLIAGMTKNRWSIMEICGGQTHTIMKYGIESMLPDEITLLHGPGCPVCVTPVEMIDKAIAIASRKDVIFTSFGDMLRVPGSEKDLLSVKAEGGDIRIVYSPLDALKIARQNRDKKVVFFAVGFETTAPASASVIRQAFSLKIDNFSILCSHVLVPPAIHTLLSSSDNRISGFLAAGHVCTVMGYTEYIPLASKFRVPIVVTGFEPVDILQGIYMTVKQLEQGKFEVANQYSRAVRREGNPGAKKIIAEFFDITHRKWRGIGEIPNSGLKLKKEFSYLDAEKIFDINEIKFTESPLCIAGFVLRGLKKPNECQAFKKQCTPENPLGAPMVSSEGACAAYYHYFKFPPY